MKSPLEQLGRTAGWVASPAFAAVAALRHARVFHPVGELLEGNLEVAAPGDDVEELAYALRGPVLARFSGALWKRRGSHLPDVMGCALRVGDRASGEQDLLFATIQRPIRDDWTP